MYLKQKEKERKDKKRKDLKNESQKKKKNESQSNMCHYIISPNIRRRNLH